MYATFDARKEFIALRPVRGLQHLCVRGVGLSDAYVLQKRCVEQELFLRHKGDFAVERLQAHLPYVLPAEADTAFVYVVIVNEQLRKRGFSAARLAHQRGQAVLRDIQRHPVQHLILPVGKVHVFKAYAMAVAMKGVLCLLQGLCVDRFFQRIYLVIDLRHGGSKGQRLDQRHADGKRQHQNQHQVRQRGEAAQHKPRPQRQRDQRHAGQYARIHGHPRPACPVPRQREISVSHHVPLIVPVAVTVAIEYLDDFHTVDILDDRVVHFLCRGIVRVHAAGSDFVHHAHRQNTDRQGAQRQKRQLPIDKEHEYVYDHRNRNIGKALRQRVSEQQLEAVDIVDKRLFDTAHAHILYRAQRLLFQLSLQRDAYVFQRIVRALVGKRQPLHIQKRVCHRADSYAGQPCAYKTPAHRFVGKQRPY